MSISATETAEASATLASNALGPKVVTSQTQPNDRVDVSTSTPVVQIDDLISHPETVSAESLAALVGGDATHWSQRGPMVWGYFDPGVVASFRHPGHGLVLSYWVGYPEPESAEDCRIAIPVSDPETRYLKCPMGTKAKIDADGVGLHIEDDTGFFEP